MSETAERVSSENILDNYVYQRCLFPYHEIKKQISGNVLEIGTGSGLSIELLSGVCEKLTTIDKFASDFDFSNYPNVEFIQMEIPPLSEFSDNSFDAVVSFQVIEHIENDTAFISEIFRVLKPKGKVYITTPNKTQSLSRNPWHIREYTSDELEFLMNSQGFLQLEKLGVNGNQKIMNYIEINKMSIRKITRFDIFNLQYKLPRKLLQIPYDFFNRLNRRNISNINYNLTKDIGIQDFFIEPVQNNSLDLFYIGTK